MSILIAVENLIDENSICCSSSEDSLYILDNIYCGRPSKPFRFTGVGSVGNPEWVCVEFSAPTRVTLAAVFNHNLTNLSSAGDEFLLKACDRPCIGSGGCDWGGAGVINFNLKSRLVDGWNDVYLTLDQTALSWRLQIIDQANPFPVEIGEFWLSEYEELASAYLQPGRLEGPILRRRRVDTDYGQHWSKSLATNLDLKIKIKNFGSVSQINQLQSIIGKIHDAGGKCVVIPNNNLPFAYYCFLENESDFAEQIFRNNTCVLKEWTLEFRTLTKGIALL